MSLRERLRARQLPTAVVTLSPVVPGADPEQVRVRAIPADDWEALVALHPPTEAQRERGDAWDPATFRSALLAACVLTPEGEEPLTEEEWADAAASGWMVVGELNALFNCAYLLNDRTPQVSALGKD